MSIEAMKLALFALDIVKIHYTQNRHVNEAIAALKERLADPMREVQRLGQEIEQEPVPTLEDLEQEIYQNTRNFVSRDVMEWMLRRYYTHPPQRTEQEPDDIASIIACRNMLDAQPVPPKVNT